MEADAVITICGLPLYEYVAEMVGEVSLLPV